MNKLIALACLGLTFIIVAVPAFATSQQDKMKGCNAEARADKLKGGERKTFMKKCLKKDYVLKSAEVPDKKGAKPTTPSASSKQLGK